MLPHLSRLNSSTDSLDDEADFTEPAAQLPLEIWIEIIQFLPYDQILPLATLSSSFQALINRELVRTPRLIDNVRIQRFLKWLKLDKAGMAQGAESITLCPRHRSKPLFVEVLTSLVNLKEVILDSTHPMSQEIDLSVLETRSEITTLSLIRIEQINQLNPIRLSHLTTLNLSDLSLSPSFEQYHLPSLKSLRLDDCRIPSNIIFPPLPNLTSLTLKKVILPESLQLSYPNLKELHFHAIWISGTEDITTVLRVIVPTLLQLTLGLIMFQSDYASPSPLAGREIYKTLESCRVLHSLSIPIELILSTTIARLPSSLKELELIGRAGAVLEPNTEVLEEILELDELEMLRLPSDFSTLSPRLTRLCDRVGTKLLIASEQKLK